jgi:hypothetical protein
LAISALLVVLIVITVVIIVTPKTPTQGRAGIGATIAQMEAAHGRDQIPGGACSSGPVCFGVKINNSEGALFQFTGVLSDDGVVDGYTQAFDNGTTISRAARLVMEWMPKDAKMGVITIDRHGGSCAMANIFSPTLAKLFGSKPLVGDPSGVVGVEFGYINANLDQMFSSMNSQQ